MNSLIVRWIDKEGGERSKKYDDEKTARKARAWLIDNGVTDVDIAVVIAPVKKQETEAPDAPLLWYND